MKIGIIGAGKVGCSIGKYLTEHGFSVAGYCSKSRKSVEEAATFTNTKACDSLAELVAESTILFLTTPDGALESVWNELKKESIQNKIVCHFSGSLSSDLFSNREEYGVSAASFHPMYAFSDKFTSYRQLNTARLTMEGSSKAVKVMQELFGDELHHKIFMLKASDKVKYHAAAFASNYVVGIFDVALGLLKDCGFTDEDAVSLLGPLTMGNVKSVIENGTLEALTGPVIRNDTGTVKKHIEALEGTDALKIYKSVGERLVKMSEKKNPDRDYSELRKIM